METGVSTSFCVGNWSFPAQLLLEMAVSKLCFQCFFGNTNWKQSFGQAKLEMFCLACLKSFRVAWWKYWYPMGQSVNVHPLVKYYAYGASVADFSKVSNQGIWGGCCKFPKQGCFSLASFWGLSFWFEILKKTGYNCSWLLGLQLFSRPVIGSTICNHKGIERFPSRRNSFRTYVFNSGHSLDSKSIQT